MAKAKLIHGVVVALLTFGCGRAPHDYLERGNSSLAAGKTAEAILNYRKAIQKQANFGEAYYRLGLAYLGNNPAEAYRALSLAASLMPDRDDVQIRFGNLCLESYLSDSSRPKVLYGQIERIEKLLLSKNANSVDGLRFEGYLALIDRRVDEASQIFQRANAIAPMREDVVLPLTQSLMDERRFAESERLARQLIEQKKSYGPIYTVLYLQYVGTNRLADAERVLESKIENNPKQEAYRLELARHYASVEDEAKLTETLRTILQDRADFPHACVDVGDFYMAIGRPAEARASFEEGLRRDPKDLIYRRRISRALLAEGKPMEAAREVEQILQQDSKDREGRRIHALLLLNEGTNDKIDLASKELLQLVQEAPEDPALRFDLGRLHMTRHDLDAARTDFRDAMTRGGDPTLARLSLAEISLQKRQPADALGYLDDVLAEQPLNLRARFLRASSLMGQRLYGPARAELERILSADKNNVDAKLQLGFLNLEEKKFSAAEAVFRVLYLPARSDLRALKGLVEVRIAQGQQESALHMLGEEAGLAKNPSAVRLLLADVAHRAAKFEIEIEQYERLLAANGRSADLYLRLAQARAAKSQLSDAIRATEQAVRIDSNNVNAHIFLADLWQEAGQAEPAKLEYRKALVLEPENPIAANNLANVLVDLGEVEEALKLVQGALHSKPDQPVFSDTLGVVYLKKNMRDAALHTFESLTKSYPENPTFRYHLAMTLLSMGQKSRAKTELETALGKKPDANRQRIKDLLASMG